MTRQPKDLEFVKSDPEWTYVFFRYVARMLSDGRLKGHPFEIFKGLSSVGEGLQKLKAGEARGRKFVFRIGDEI